MALTRQKMYQVKSSTLSYHNVIISSDFETKLLFISHPSITYGNNTPDMHEYYDLIQCYNFQRFGHVARQCSFAIKCKICAMNHHHQECIHHSKVIACSNCIQSSTESHRYNSRHKSSHLGCPIRQQLIHYLKATIMRHTSITSKIKVAPSNQIKIKSHGL